MNTLTQLSMILFSLIQWVLDIFYSIISSNVVKKVVPRSKNELLHMSATKLAEKIRKKEISSEELISAYIKRIQEVNPIINAVVEDRFTAALAEAKEVDKYLKNVDLSINDLAKTKPLLGIPITSKETIPNKGLSLTGCSLVRKGEKADKDAEAIRFFKDAGAIILLVSSVPEYCSAIDATNNIIGRTYNPYDSTRTVGGGTGGEGALLGAGASVIGLGTDIGGSIRIPSAFNGIYGHKPTSGYFSQDGSFPWFDDKNFLDYLVTGPMTRYVEDLKLALGVLAGDSAEKLNLDKEVDLQNLKVFYMEDTFQNFGLLKVDKQIKTAIKDAVKYLNKNYKCQINETKFPEMDAVIDMATLPFAKEGAPSVFTDTKVKYSPFIEFLKYLVGQSIFTFHSFFMTFVITFGSSKAEVLANTKLAAQFKQKFINTLGNNGVFITPTYPTEAFKSTSYLTALSGVRFTPIANLIDCPATSIPIGRSKNGLPLSIQIMAPPCQDHLCLKVAEELASYFGGWEPPC